MASLQDVERPTHVPLAQLDQGLGRLGQDLDALLLNHLIDQHPDVPLLQRTEPKPCAPGQQRGAELVRVVGNDAEPRVGRVFFHDASQRHLRRIRHGIRLVENDQLEATEAGARCPAEAEDLFCGCKRLDLLPHHIDAAIVRGVELKHHLSHVIGAVDSSGEGEDGRGLSGARGPVEEEVGKSVRVNEFVDGCEDVLVARHIVERRGSVFFNPAMLDGSQKGAK